MINYQIHTARSLPCAVKRRSQPSINSGLLEGSLEFPYTEPQKIFSRLCGNYKHKFLFESKDISPIYGRMSLAGVDPVVKITGKKDTFCIEVLNSRGSFYLREFTDDDFKICDKIEISEEKIKGIIKNQSGIIEETERSKRKNIAQVIRILLKKFAVGPKSFLGLYGAFSYDFIRLFEDIGDNNPASDTNDFTLFLYDTFLFFDHLKQTNEIIVYRKNTQEAEKDINAIAKNITQNRNEKISYNISNAKFELDKKEYESLVELAKKYAADGELFEVVFSNVLKAEFKGDPFGLYLKYRDVNPSPYLFYFDFGKEQLVGASPEMMVRCENNIVSLRPISGTAARGKDPIEDHENMLSLLSDKKEKAELDMLIDLGRNDLSRVCESGIEITDYRFVEKYSRVMHTVAHLSGKLRKGYTALDALVACLNAGTLTGAPKVAAMTVIEKHEKERRGYYGGTIGYLTFSGDMDTGIIIRTAHIRGRKLRFQVGATLLHDSVPEKEYQEVLDKAEAFLDTFDCAVRPLSRNSSSLCSRVALKYKNILIIDNFDSFTFNLVDYFKRLGCIVNVYRNNIECDLIEKMNPDLIVISPGPSIPKNAGNLMKIIAQYHTKYPMFGVCLGHEALIEYFGGTLKFTEPVHGKSSKIHHDGNGIFKDIEQDFNAGRYHSLAVDKMPDCFEKSATACGLVMAVRHKKLPIDGVQFHPESVLTMKGGNGFKIIKNLIS